MDRKAIGRHLNQARRHVAAGLIHIARQRAIIARLEADGLDAAHARNALKTLQSMQAAHVADCHRLDMALAAAKSPFSFRDDVRRATKARAVTQESVTELLWYQAKIAETAQVLQNSKEAVEGSREILVKLQRLGPDVAFERA